MIELVLTGFHWVLLGNTGFYVFFCCLPSFIEFYWVYLDFLAFTGCYWVFTSFHLVLLGFYCNLVLLGFTVFTGFYPVLPVFTGFYRVVLGFKVFFWVFVGFNGF